MLFVLYTIGLIVCGAALQVQYQVSLSREETEEWMQVNGGDAIQERPGEDKRCLTYCPFGKPGLCP